MRAYERLIKYVKVHTTSDERSGQTPSTARQFDLAEMLVEEMKAIGIEDARVDDKCYVYGSIPATEGYGDKPAIGFLAHLDTSPDCSGENVSPCIRENYDGGEVELKNGIVLSPKMFPDLLSLKGKTLITADGTTLLGADNKAGIAEIMTMAEKILCGERLGEGHGRICISFIPDEEIGAGARDLDLSLFGADFAYTVDGEAENEIEYENFNAAAAEFVIKGRSVHPGFSKDRMINAALVAMQVNSMLPAAETPAHTEGREGFFHMTSVSGNVEAAKVSYIIRDHSEALFEARKNTLRMIEKILNEQYRPGTVTLTIRDQYRNMVEKIRPCMHLVEYAEESIRARGMESISPPVRGGTDGAQLSYRGLPCPNLGTGGYAFHGPFEHITAEAMDEVVEILCGIIGRYAEWTEDVR